VTTDQANEQDDVTRWFDETYRAKGLGYLRPLQAYPIYLQLLDARPGHKLLDVGCGPGLLLKAAGMRGVGATGIDVSAEAIQIAAEFVADADLRVGNAEEMPFADGTFDFVTCIGVLERFFDRERALAELLRVSRDDARFCCMVRNSRGVGWKVFREWLGRQNHEGHQDAMGLEEWRRLFESNGFVIDDILVDQWPRQKIRRVLRGFRHPDFRRPEPIARPMISMRFAYEYIFLLRKGGS
jgi:ubiquinone/menaquinone biosynthesis C-methylase UbiE